VFNDTNIDNCIPRFIPTVVMICTQPFSPLITARLRFQLQTLSFSKSPFKTTPSCSKIHYEFLETLCILRTGVVKSPKPSRTVPLFLKRSTTICVFPEIFVFHVTLHVESFTTNFSSHLSSEYLQNRIKELISGCLGVSLNKVAV
jgi:hypothetical protein